MKTILVLSTALTLMATMTPASATTYVFNRTVGTGSVTGSITTNNTLGTLSTSNITAFNLTLNDGTTTFNLTNMNGAIQIDGSALTATANALSFNYSVAGYALFQSPGIGSSIDFFCFQGTSTACADNTNVGGDLLKITGAILKTEQAGNQQVGGSAAGAVPEPASWAMMILGMGSVGFGLRRRHKIVTTVTFA